MPDWNRLIEMATEFETELKWSLARIEKPPINEDDPYSNFYDALEVALGYLGDAHTIGQAALKGKH